MAFALLGFRRVADHSVPGPSRAVSDGNSALRVCPRLLPFPREVGTVGGKQRKEERGRRKSNPNCPGALLLLCEVVHPLSDNTDRQ